MGFSSSPAPAPPPPPTQTESDKPKPVDPSALETARQGVSDAQRRANRQKLMIPLNIGGVAGGTGLSV